VRAARARGWVPSVALVPCVVHSITVATTCNLDFGSRALVLAGRILLVGNGNVGFSAGSIRQDGDIVSKVPTGVGLGSANDVTLNGKISLLGIPSALGVFAGGDVDVNGTVRVPSSPQQGFGEVLSAPDRRVAATALAARSPFPGRSSRTLGVSISKLPNK